MYCSAVLAGASIILSFPKSKSLNLAYRKIPKKYEEVSQKWTTLLDAADKQVLEQFPVLANPPSHFERLTKSTGTRLYNGIAPLNDDSIACLGHILLSNSFRNAEAQAIWTTAFFDKRMVLPETEQAEKEIACMNAFSR